MFLSVRQMYSGRRTEGRCPAFSLCQLPIHFSSASRLELHSHHQVSLAAVNLHNRGQPSSRHQKYPTPPPYQGREYTKNKGELTMAFNGRRRASISSSSKHAEPPPYKHLHSQHANVYNAVAGELAPVPPTARQTPC